MLTIPNLVGYPTLGISLPEMLSFCISDDGTGGSLAISVGVASIGGIDLKEEFENAGLIWHSQPLEMPFRRSLLIPENNDQALKQIVSRVAVIVTPSAGTGIYELPDVSYADASGTPVVTFTRPNGGEAPPTGIWRVEFRLRHSITN